MRKLLILSFMIPFFQMQNVFASTSLDMKQVPDKWLLYYSDFYSFGFRVREVQFYFFNKDTNISSFSSDGCSSFPDGTSDYPKLWRDCCIAHDIMYWVGGAKDLKAQADQELKQCVSQRIKLAYEEENMPSKILLAIANLMKKGVGVGGSPHLYTPWRWAYGWKSYRGYSEMSSQEMDNVEFEIERYIQKLKLANQEEFTKYGLPQERDFILDRIYSYRINN